MDSVGTLAAILRFEETCILLCKPVGSFKSSAAEGSGKENLDCPNLSSWSCPPLLFQY